MKSAIVTAENQPILQVHGLDIGMGERIAVVGRSGSGKTTFLKMLAGLVPFDGEPITFRNTETTDCDSVSSFTKCVEPRLLRNRGIQIAYVPQQLGLWSQLSILSNVTLPALRAADVPLEEAERKCRAILSELGLLHKLRDRPSQLSGGEQQRVAIARAALCAPQLILLDEITSALDPTTTGEILGLLPRLFPSSATIIFVTHQFGFAREFATHVAFFSEGHYITKVPRLDIDSGVANKVLLSLVEDSKKFYSW